jgi:hypothetical protein
MPGLLEDGEREVGFDLSLATAWPPADSDPGRHVDWVRQGWEALRPHSVGVYVNFLTDEEPPAFRPPTASAWSAWSRLMLRSSMWV